MNAIIHILEQKKAIIINPYHGLGNRLRVIASAYSIAKSYERVLIINWIPSIHCNCVFEDLFISPNDVYIYVII